MASALLVAAGDNPQRLRSEASFARLCGVAPLDASSGRHNRHDSYLMKPNRITEWPPDRLRAASGYLGELVGCSWSWMWASRPCS